MHCHICDKQLANDEIKHEPHYGKGGFAPCSQCLEIIGELFNDDSDDEITEQLTAEGIFMFELFQKDSTEPQKVLDNSG